MRRNSVPGLWSMEGLQIVSRNGFTRFKEELKLGDSASVRAHFILPSLLNRYRKKDSQLPPPIDLVVRMEAASSSGKTYPYVILNLDVDDAQINLNTDLNGRIKREGSQEFLLATWATIFESALFVASDSIEEHQAQIRSLKTPVLLNDLAFDETIRNRSASRRIFPFAIGLTLFSTMIFAFGSKYSYKGR